MADQENIGTLLSKIAVDVADLKKGLSDGRNELNSFKKLSQEVGEQVKKALTFAGIGFGLYEGLSKLKEFASEILDVGKKSEMLRISTYVLAQNLKMSADTVDYYVAKLTGLGLTTERSFHAIQAFLKSGLPIDQIAPFIETLRNIAPTVTSTGGAFGPFFDQIMKSMESGRPRGLMQMGIPGFQEFLISLKKDGDEAMMTITEKAQALYDYLTKYSQSLKGVSEAVGDTYVSQAAKLERLKTETKEALFELVKPVAMAISGEQIKTWDDLYVAVTKNKTALKDLGETIAIYVGRIANFIRTIAEFAVAHKELVEVLLQVWTISKVINFLSISAGAAAATLAIGGTISKLAALRLALAGPWGLVIAVTIVGLYEGIKAVKCDILLELADIRLALKDMPQAEKALVEAVATAPDHQRAFARLSRFFRSPNNPGPGGLDAVSYARSLGAVIARGQQLGTSDPRWFASLGHIEVEQLNRLRDGVNHLQRAVQMEPTLHECRFELAMAYSRLGAHDDATKTVMSMMNPVSGPLVAISDPAAALELLERSLNAERRAEEAIVVSELRAIAGELDDGRHGWLRGRRLPPFEAHHAILDRGTLVTHVVPPEGRHLFLEIAAAISGIETKLLRADISEIGIFPRDRIGRRSGNPTRALLDRLCRALGIPDIELVITPNVSRTRVLAQDGLWVVVPKSLTELPEPTQLASLGRALARVALNVPWLEELPPPHIEAMLVAAARTVYPQYGKDDVDVISMKLVQQYEPNVAKELTRKQKQLLERLVPLMTSQAGRMISTDVLIGALARAELRIAYVLTGDVLATIDELRGLDGAFLKATEAPGRGAVAAALNHPFAGDVVRFAMTPEATALRRRVGSTWAG